MKTSYVIIFYLFLFSLLQKSLSQIKKPISSYELSNSPQWLKIPGGFASFTQLDYNKDGKDDIMQFQGYDLSTPYTWPGPFFYKNINNELILDSIQLNNKKLFAGKILNGDFNNDGLIDMFLLTGMDPAGCTNCKDPIFPLYKMINIDTKSFKVDSIRFSGVWRNGTAGDIDNDGDLDVIAFCTHHEYSNNIFNRVLLNDGKGNFTYTLSDLDSIGWVDRVELIDMNNDDYLDLVMNDVYSPDNNYANRFRILWNDRSGKFYQNNSVKINIPNDFFVLDINSYDVDNDGFKEIIIPMNNAKTNFKLLIYKTTDNKLFTDISNFFIKENYFEKFNIWDEPMAVYDWDKNGKVDLVINNKELGIRWEWNGKYFERNYCNSSIKPAFNTSKYSFCSGDSLKLSIPNVNKGDTLKWYFGTRSDLSNVANKTFTDSTKLYVTRTDSVGCMISSDTIQITKNSIPISPGISRDSDNNLVANTNSITWYKDGVKIADTTQKMKPTSNGNYTATTTQNGCTSSASANYYYLTSAVANLSSDEYFKVSPNPTDGEIYLNYNIRSTRDVYINVVDMSGRTIISNRKVTSGSKLNLGSSMKGNYIIQVKDKTGRLLTTEKLIKN